MVKTNEPIVFGAVTGAALLCCRQVGGATPKCARTIVAASACVRRAREDTIRMAFATFNAPVRASQRKAGAIVIKSSGNSALRHGDIGERERQPQRSAQHEQQARNARDSSA